jgi:hypothetical protein
MLNKPALAGLDGGMDCRGLAIEASTHLLPIFVFRDIDIFQALTTPTISPQRHPNLPLKDSIHQV